MGEFLMPSLGADMEAGTLVEWLVKPGDVVKRGDIVAVVETQKGAIEIEIFDAGVVEQLLVQPNATVPVGTPLALLRGEGEAASVQPPAPEPPAGPEPTITPAPSVTPTPPSPPAGSPGERPKASPAARRRAGELGVDITVVDPGPDGIIEVADIEAALPRPPSQAGKPRFDFAEMRAAIAAAMSRSKREIPHYYLSDTIDMAAAEGWLAGINADRPPDRRLLTGVLFVKAVGKAARAYPEFNGLFVDGVFRPAPAVHVGLAIALRGGGLAAPAIHDVADLDLDTLMARTRDLVARVREGRFRSSEIADPTITVSSMGDRGVEALFGVIYPPQVAIVGFGKVVRRPWIVEGAVTPRPVATVTLAADHRVSDGHRGGLFLAEIGRLLQTPEAL
ncbi:MAG: dihydrolipoamide acetyltransferase family protein [Brevundimonas sp.]|uniref:dihydrolipoamide acetyltransferase family protein n=1 Tax=Brevundimonas sp. TaxID=1871086 RepID=UPI0027186CCB|nr:dihydrolipoamide acetyltransferase family protein [Brevundimonas sp.]MDO9586999.1 dihydrolipoamide acetyltransferase family protein [Brevundimonas sp.]MDP3658278.1 dihydrolipoamide acetyltransferase family protein [Brevundimonas sp.]MDZ4112981.1 dihydrolipoamide acetyltransferase family protein [Brevundimonas sp.]